MIALVVRGKMMGESLRGLVQPRNSFAEQRNALDSASQSTDIIVNLSSPTCPEQHPFQHPFSALEAPHTSGTSFLSFSSDIRPIHLPRSFIPCRPRKGVKRNG